AGSTLFPYPTLFRSAAWGRRPAAGGDLALEALQALEDGLEGVIRLWSAQAHEGDLEDDAGVGLLGQLDERLAQHLEGSGEPGRRSEEHTSELQSREK